jgi:hypothetical protein
MVANSLREVPANSGSGVEPSASPRSDLLAAFLSGQDLLSLVTQGSLSAAELFDWFQDPQTQSRIDAAQQLDAAILERQAVLASKRALAELQSVLADNEADPTERRRAATAVLRFPRGVQRRSFPRPASRPNPPPLPHLHPPEPHPDPRPDPRPGPHPDQGPAPSGDSFAEEIAMAIATPDDPESNDCLAAALAPDAAFAGKPVSAETRLADILVSWPHAARGRISHAHCRCITSHATAATYLVTFVHEGTQSRSYLNLRIVRPACSSSWLLGTLSPAADSS